MKPLRRPRFVARACIGDPGVLSYVHMRRAAAVVLLTALALVARDTPVVARSGAAPLTEGGEIPWFLLLTPEVIKALLIAVGILLLVALVVALVIYRSLRRSGRWDRAVLLMRSRYDDGPRAELARLRLRLLEALAGGRRAVEINAAGGNFSGELAGLQRRLQRLAVPHQGRTDA